MNNLDHYEIKFENEVKSCEDVFLVEDRHMAVMACDPSREKRNMVMVSNITVKHMYSKVQRQQTNNKGRLCFRRWNQR